MDGVELAGVLEAVRLAVYRSLADTGHLPSPDRLAEIAGSPIRAGAAIAELARQRAWALGPDGAIELADPFATRSFGHSVMSATTRRFSRSARRRQRGSWPTRARWRTRSASRCTGCS